MARTPVHEGLYDPQQRTPTLRGSRCGRCGASFFPPIDIGCERCGSTDLHPAPFSAAGVVHAAATVHRHSGHGIQAPFTVAEIALDDGPLIRAVLTNVDDHIVGGRVAAEWVATGRDEEGNDLVEPRFRVVLPEPGA